MKKLVLTLISCLLITNLFAQHSQLEQSIKSIIKGKKATVGVAVIFDDNTTLTVNDGYRYPTMSTFKLPLSVVVLDHMNKKKLPLETEILVKKSDLLPETHSPLRDNYPNGNVSLPISELITYTMAQSDNNACDILFNYIGGPSVVNSYLQDLGLSDINIAANEAMMNEESDNQYLNWTSPSASTLFLEIFLRKDLVSEVYKNFLIETMEKTTTGTNKIKGNLPKDVVVGHKTGSSHRTDFGMKIGENDLGFVKLPNGKQFSIGVFVMNSMEDDRTNCSIIADIAKEVYDYYNK